MQKPKLEQTKEKQILRKCKYCGLIATTEIELEMFKKNRESKYGREQVCKYCHNEFKDTKKPPCYKKKEHHTWLRKCTKCGLEANTIEELAEFITGKYADYGRKNICIKCNNRYYVKPWKKKHPPKNNYYDADPVKYRCRLEAAKYPLKDKCENCESTKNLQRHHPDHSHPEIFITLCSKCHNALKRKEIKF